MSVDNRVGLSTFRRTSFAVAIMLAGACSPTPTVTPSSPEVYPYDPSHLSPHLTDTAPLTTPGARADAIQATAIAFREKGWREMVAKGFPENPIISAYRIDLQRQKYAISGSGTIFNFGDYYVILTAGHVLTNRGDQEQDNEVIGLEISRGKELPNSGLQSFKRNSFGMADTMDEGVDFGVIVIAKEGPFLKGENKILGNTPELSEETVYFGDSLLMGEYFGVSFPVITGRQTTVIDKGRLPDYTSPLGDTQFLVGGSLIELGSSGCGVWVRQPGSMETKYVGPGTGFAPQIAKLVDNTFVTDMRLLGEEKLLELINAAIADLESQNK